MSLTDWIVIGAAIVLAPLLGSIAAAVTKKILSRDSNPEAIQKSASPISGLVFSIFLVIGLVTVLTVFKPEVLDNLTNDLIDFIPKALVAAIILIGANVLSTFVITALSTATARMPMDVQQKTNMLVRGIIITMAALLAVGQIGIDTEVVNMFLAAILFCGSLSIALLIGLGGRKVATEVAVARSLKRQIAVGDELAVDEHSGTVTSIGPTHIELRNQQGSVRVPAKTLLASSYTLKANSVSQEG